MYSVSEKQTLRLRLWEVKLVIITDDTAWTQLSYAILVPNRLVVVGDMIGFVFL